MTTEDLRSTIHRSTLQYPKKPSKEQSTSSKMKSPSGPTYDFLAPVKNAEAEEICMEPFEYTRSPSSKNTVSKVIARLRPWLDISDQSASVLSSPDCPVGGFLIGTESTDHKDRDTVTRRKRCIRVTEVNKAKGSQTRTMTASTDLPDRDALTKRSVPSMVLSDGSPSSMTAPPTSKPESDATKGAQERFTVRGNAVVAGGAGTLGLRSCDALLEHGLQGLMILDRDPTISQQEIDALRTKFPTAKIATRKVDVTDERAVEAAMDETSDILGSVDALLCFVGVVGCVESLEMPIAQWRKVMDINTTGSFICAQAAARRMVAQGTGGSITFIASISAHRVNFPQPQAAYNVSKAALLMLKSCLAAEWARYGIRTNSLSPGYMDTILNAGDGIADHRRIWAERNPSGRMGVPSELTGAVVLLVSSAGSYINGADIVVDGGQIVF
ncbi:hypothetical protein BDV28DRAFT_144774 [Aspergillus coremiiformis]|uniref:Oxidoreductase n=1 Tax=Aspergillus coremiiformis TaxID=138285 RepID=A0A5N6ZGW1_9EURO|nr:hypothetical protein BDV28DRAFT_144774 [Aspergillus coremiiformis]